MPRAKVLIVEDDAPIRSLMVRALGHAGLEVDTARDGAEALEKVAGCNYAVILLDLLLPIVSGKLFLQQYRQLCPGTNTVVIAMTAYDERATSEIDRSAIHAVVRKPFDLPKLVEMTRLATLLYDQNARSNVA